MKIKKIHSHFSQGIKKLSPFFFIFLFSIVSLSVVFFTTRGINPHAQELNFTEYSILGSDSGSVIPASCESSPFLVANGDGNYSGCATVTCWNGAVITPAMGESCPAQPAPTADIHFN